MGCTAVAVSAVNISDVKRGQNLKAKAEARTMRSTVEAEVKNNYEKVPNND